MDGYGPSTYGDRWADVYDEWFATGGPFGDAAAAVSFLADLAGPGPVLELGIGTGRVAIPLRERSVEVHGIDASEAMVARLRAKPGGGDLPVTIADFASFEVGTTFTLVYVVFNTFFGLLTQDDQVGTFQAVARHLEPGGTFVMEAFVPDAARYDRGQRVGATQVGPEHVRLEVSMHDPIEQRTDSQIVEMRSGRVDLYPARIRYAYISELDLMARLAGMRMRERWGDWDRSPLTSASPRHVSVWELES